jgi:hypothetical protein
MGRDARIHKCVRRTSLVFFLCVFYFSGAEIVIMGVCVFASLAGFVQVLVSPVSSHVSLT